MGGNVTPEPVWVKKTHPEGFGEALTFPNPRPCDLAADPPPGMPALIREAAASDNTNARIPCFSHTRSFNGAKDQTCTW